MRIRHRIVDDCLAADTAIVWRTVTEHLPRLFTFCAVSVHVTAVSARVLRAPCGRGALPALSRPGAFRERSPSSSDEGKRGISCDWRRSATSEAAGIPSDLQLERRAQESSKTYRSLCRAETRAVPAGRGML